MNESGAHRSMSADPDPGGGSGAGGPLSPQGPAMPQQPMSPPTRDYGATSGGGGGGTSNAPDRFDLGNGGGGGGGGAGDLNATASAFAYAMRPPPVTSAAGSELFVHTTPSSASLRPRPPTAGGNAAASGSNMFNVGSPQPDRNDAPDVELDYGQNNVPLLKAQLKVT